MLNLLWCAFFIIAGLAGLYHAVVTGDSDVFNAIVASTFDMAKLSVEIAIGLVGVLCFWLGILKIGEQAGLIQAIARMLQPLFRRLMPEVPDNHPAQGNITMNLAANVLGLDNAATPIGIRAMENMQELNPNKDVATNAQILFLVLNTSSVTLLPITVFLYRAQQGAPEPASIYIPLLLATSASTMAGLLSVAFIQRLRIWDPVVLAYLGIFSAIIGGTAWLFLALPSALQSHYSTLTANLILLGVITGIIGFGMVRKVPVYESFIEGAKHGFSVAVKLIPYLIAMMVAIGVLRASGALDILLEMTRHAVQWMGMDTRFVDALPTAFLKPLSGSASRAMMLETMHTHGVDSFPALLAATIQGSTETTFYVLAVYFGAVGLKRIRHALVCGLIADVAGISTAIAVGYAFFG